MQADISACLKGLLKTLNPKILKAVIALIEAGKNKSISLSFMLPFFKNKKKTKKYKFIYIFTSIIALFFSPFHSRHFKNTCAIHRELLSKRQPCLGKAV